MWRSCQLYLEIFKSMVWCLAPSYLEHPGISRTIHTWKLPVLQLFIYTGRMFTHATRKDLLYDCSWHAHRELCILYIVSFYYAYVTCIFIFQIEYRFITHANELDCCCFILFYFFCKYASIIKLCSLDINIIFANVKHIHCFTKVRNFVAKSHSR